MNRSTKTILAAAFVGVAMMTSAAVAKTPTTEGQTKQAKRNQVQTVRKAHDQRHGGQCGKGHRVGHQGGRRLVTSEAKFQTKDGFATAKNDIGKVTAVNASAKTITIKRADDQSVSATGNDRTHICVNAKRGSWADIKVGDNAGLLQITREGEQGLRALRVFSPKPAASS